MNSFSLDCQGGKGMAGYGVNVAPTLAAISHGTPHACAFYRTRNCNIQDTALSITEGAHGVTLQPVASAVNGTGGKPGQGYPAVLIQK